MKKKIVGILVCTLLIIPVLTSTAKTNICENDLAPEIEVGLIDCTTAPVIRDQDEKFSAEIINNKDSEVEVWVEWYYDYHFLGEERRIIVPALGSAWTGEMEEHWPYDFQRHWMGVKVFYGEDYYGKELIDEKHYPFRAKFFSINKQINIKAIYNGDVPANIVNEAIKKTITVDDDGGADYTKIQDAVDNADPGDTIFVYSGTYYENIVIDVSIDLIGEDKETTIIDGSGDDDVINVSAEDVSISGFTIQHSGNHWYYDGGIDIRSNNCLITDNNIVFHPENGILIKSSFNTISSNYFSNIGRGIVTHYNHDNFITDNTITDAAVTGIKLSFNSDDNTVCNNIVYDSTIGIGISAGIDNIIFNNHLYENQDGIDLHTCSNTLVYENIIEDNWAAGIDANYGSADNFIFHNNFLNNKRSAYDYDMDDIWDKGYPIGGNYWSDYDGIDADGDGVGDTPYNLWWKHGYDYYPLIEPFGNFRINPSGPYYSFINTPIQLNGYACSGTPPYEWFWDFGDDTTSDEQNPTHTYTEIGKYTVSLTVIDDEGKQETLSTYAWIQDGNTEPNKPKISGPKIIRAHKLCQYTFCATDPDDSPIYYYIDWGNGEIEEWFGEEWLGPFDSGDPQTIRHIWWEEGSYVISAQVKDVFGEESDWGTLQVTVLKSRTRTNTLFLQLLELIQKIFPRLYNLLEI